MKTKTPKEYWDERFNQWKKWVKNGSEYKDFPWTNWEYPSDKLKNKKWKWGNHKHSVNILPEPYWGNPTQPSVIFININPGAVEVVGGVQDDLSKLNKFNYYQIAAENKLKINVTQDWHQKRFKWVSGLGDESINPSDGLSIELIPWHSKSASDITNYIMENGSAVIDNLIRFQKVLPNKGLFSNTFIVRSAAFMDLLEKEVFAKYFDLTKITHFSLARKRVILKPMSFLTCVRFKKKFGGTEFLIFHGGSSNQMPPLDYILIEKQKTLKLFLETRNTKNK